MLGFKGLAWRSVEIPPINPKPKLTPLTGGYRRTPVLQDGADVWCDTRLIARELERRVPEPSFFPPKTSGAADAIAWWAEQQFMRPTALYVVRHQRRAHARRLCTRIAPSCMACRSPPSRRCARLRPATSISCGHRSAGLPTCYADGRPYLLGDTPCIADFATYHVVWFYRGRHIDCRQELAPYPRLLAGATAWPRSATASARTSTPTRRWPKRAQRRRRHLAPRSHRKAILSRGNARAFAPPTMPRIGSRAR